MFGLNWLDKHLFLANVSIMMHSLALADISKPPKMEVLFSTRLSPISEKVILVGDSENSPFDLLVRIAYILLCMKMRIEHWWDSSDEGSPKYSTETCTSITLSASYLVEWLGTEAMMPRAQASD